MLADFRRHAIRDQQRKQARFVLFWATVITVNFGLGMFVQDLMTTHARIEVSE